MNSQFILRICYAKHDRVAYLSHLETIHAVERIIRRACLPYAMTEGFNPHMKISFCLALPVGASSKGEYTDVRLSEFIRPTQALEMLKAAAPRDLEPLSCEYISTKAPSAAAAFTLSEWSVCVSGVRSEELKAAIDALLERGFIEVFRKRKAPRKVSFEGKLVKGPTLYEKSNAPRLSQSTDDVQSPTLHEANSEVELRFTTRACADGSLRPDKFVEAALSAFEGAHITSITRLCQKIEQTSTQASD